jgi:hypothetical protein
VASGLLHQLLEEKKLKRVARARAFYLLGLTETHIRISYWVSLAEHYLEMAIRTAPRSKVAREAFALLEQETLLAYGGSSGVMVPDDVQARLDELRRLMKGKTKRGSGKKKGKK